MSELLQAEHVSNYYQENGLGIFSKRKSVQVLHDVSFTIHQNEFFGLVGESGCGKTTLGNSILGLIPYEGSILVDGQPYSRKEKKAFARKVQAVFQDPLSALNPRRTIGQTMEEPLVIHGIGDRRERIERVNEMLEMIGLDSSYRNRYPSELSGGQRQRVCIGAALMLSPKLIVADEAVSALDVSVGSQILNLFRELHEKVELSLLFISHNLNVVYYLCDRIAVMYRGNIVEIGTADDIYLHPKHPYTELLLSAIPDIEAEVFHKKGNEEKEVLREDVPGCCCFYHRCPYASETCKTPVPLKPAEGSDGEHLVRCSVRNN